MWERFSTSGLAGAYLDGLLADGVKACMEFRPRRALDPYPFLVRLADEEEGEAFFTRLVQGCAMKAAPVSNPEPGPERGRRSRLVLMLKSAHRYRHPRV